LLHPLGLPLCASGVCDLLAGNFQGVKNQGDVKVRTGHRFCYLAFTFEACQRYFSQLLGSRENSFAFLVFTTEHGSLFPYRRTIQRTFYLVSAARIWCRFTGTDLSTVCAEQFGTNIAQRLLQRADFLRGRTRAHNMGFNKLTRVAWVDSFPAQAIVSVLCLFRILGIAWVWKETYGKELDYIRIV